MVKNASYRICIICVFMNINKTLKNKGTSLYKKGLFHPNIVIVAYFDKSIHPVVLHEYYRICIFMNIHENVKK